MSDEWLLKTLTKAEPIQSSPREKRLISKLLDTIDNLGCSAGERQIALAAAFDLVVAAEYYSTVAQHWLVVLPTITTITLLPLY